MKNLSIKEINEMFSSEDPLLLDDKSLTRSTAYRQALQDPEVRKKRADTSKMIHQRDDVKKKHRQNVKAAMQNKLTIDKRSKAFSDSQKKKFFDRHTPEQINAFKMALAHGKSVNRRGELGWTETAKLFGVDVRMLRRLSSCSSHFLE